MIFKNNLFFEDFLLDESFQKYVEKSDISSIHFWEEWIHDHPELETEIIKARETIEALSDINKNIHHTDKKQSLHELLVEIKNTKRSRISRHAFWIKVAALIIIVSGISLVLFLSGKKDIFNSEMQSYEILVPPGQKSQVILSDGTEVWINSGSKLKYPVTFNRPETVCRPEHRQTGIIIKVYNTTVTVPDEIRF